jgi:hypothetical protein
VTVIGYDNTPGALKYEAYNTYDHVAHWYSFAAVAPGVSYGVKSATFFNPGYLPGDTNRDGVVNSLDIDAIYQHLTVAPPGYTNWPRTLLTWSPALAQYDVNGDGSVSQADVTYELNTYFLTSYGDADLNKASDFQDFQTLLNHWQATGAGVGWADGDFNGDGVVDFLDFQNLLNYWNPGGWNFAPAQAPEPVSLALLGLGGLAILRRNRRTSSGPRPGEKGDTRRNSSLERKLKRNLSSIPGNCRNVSASSNFVSGQFKSAFKGDVS